ncbi:MAG: VOC family protein [Acidobacteria bacterium]|nr:VOC family protein [Acidobacteriota bacterium]
MIEKFDHVAMVVKNTDETVELMKRLFGFEVGDVLTESDAGFKSTMILKSGVTIELIEPVGPEGTMQKFLERRGGGLHHISIRVSDLEEEIKQLRAKGVQFVTEEPIQVNDFSKVIFVHPRSTNGLLIELSQKEREHSAL